jgi:transcriptional regulator NrdR family protein
MCCPLCAGSETTVRGTKADCEAIHRQRMCLDCGHVFYTSEYESDGKEFTRLMREYERERYQNDQSCREQARRRYQERKARGKE